MGGYNDLRSDRAICRHIASSDWRPVSSGIDAVRDSKATGVRPGELPDFLRRAPDRAEAFRALAQSGFLVADAHGDDVLLAPSRCPGLRPPRDGFDNELDGLEAPAVGGIVEVARAHEPFAEARDFVVPGCASRLKVVFSRHGLAVGASHPRIPR
jgi:hypothetical protein